ncbi:MAG TPA: CheR family methyltransferase [Mucilaginibacter sp.]|jgi:two-component system CheB/CheR fusion protein
MAEKKISPKKLAIVPKQHKNKSFPVVAIGGSAGAFPAIKQFFTHMPGDAGIAFIIIMHLDPNHKGQVAQVIGNYTSMHVVEAVDGQPIEADHVYIIPPNRDMGIHNRKLLLLNQAKPNGFRQPIDYFFQSLADDQWNRAVGIVLSGMGSDGETGMRLIKEKLGMVMVQDPETAEYRSMPDAAVGTNLIDYVLSPEEMPLKLIQYLKHPIMADEPNEQARNEIRNGNSIQKVLMLLRTQTGHDFSMYKKSTVIRRIDRRIAFHQLPDYVHYVNFLRENPQEIDVLFSELLIGVTKFFRDAAAFEALKNKLRNVVHAKKNNDPIRVWVAGCSTGEEAYSIAMLVMECLEQQQRKKMPKIQIFATDLDAEAIELARQGIYHDNIAADVSEERLAKYFTRTEGGYAVKKDLREMIVFAQHNLIKDAPFTRLDLLCCRNVMIYLTSELQKKIIPIFHYSLNLGGIMFMGPAETIGGFTELFVSIDPKWKIFERKGNEMTVNRVIDFPFHVAKHPTHLIALDEPEKQQAKISIADTFNKIVLENFAPCSVLINDRGDILYSNGKTGNYLELPRGEAAMNIFKMAREELKYVLGNIIHQARTQKSAISINDVKLREGNTVRLLNLHASIMDPANNHSLILVVFDDRGPLKKTVRGKNKGDPGKDQVLEDMEKELVYTKQQLHSTIEQMETSLEELKSTNEELQSTNEELQSTNEESLTTKEEMQSLNEELMTVNVQYQSKAEELTRLNNDMKNLLDSTEIGTIFLNTNLEILRYTPQIKKLFNVIPSDIGRSLSDIVANLDYQTLKENINEVVERLLTREIELKTKGGEWYSIRIMPYRTLDNFISGAVLTFSDITGYKQMEYKLRALQKYSAGVVNIIQQPALQLDKDFTVVTANDEFATAFVLPGDDLIGIPFEKFAAQKWRLKDMELPKDGGKKAKKQFLFKEERYELSSIPFIDEETNEILTILILINKMGIAE